MNLQCKFDSAILIDDIFDHLPTVALLRQMKVSDKSPIEYSSRRLNAKKISQIHHKLCTINWNGILNSDDINTNTNRFMSEMEAVMNTEAPLQTIRISGKRCFNEPWITKGIEAAARKNRNLYRKTLKSSCTEQDITIYKTHRNMLNRLQQSTRVEYYNTNYYEYKQNTKKLWALINQTIKKCKNGGTIIPYITVEGLQTYNSRKNCKHFWKILCFIRQGASSNNCSGKTRHKPLPETYS